MFRTLHRKLIDITHRHKRTRGGSMAASFLCRNTRRIAPNAHSPTLRIVGQIAQPELMQTRTEDGRCRKSSCSSNELNDGLNDEHNEHNEHNKLSERQLRIIEYIAENPTITLSELAAKEDVAKITIRRDLNVMQKKGVISRQGRTRAGRWDILKH